MPVNTSPEENSEENEAVESSGLPDSKNFTALLSGSPDEILERHKQTATKLLGISVDYCENFVPQQITNIEQHIEKINRRIERGSNAIEVQNLTGSLLALFKAHAEILERAVIVYMSNTRPLVSLLTTNQLEISAEARSTGDMTEELTPEMRAELGINGDNNEGGIFSDDDDDIDLDSLHQPYTD